MKRDIFSELVEGFESLAKERRQHISVARELAPAGLRSSPNPGEAGVSVKQQLPEVLASASPERRPAGGNKLSWNKLQLADFLRIKKYLLKPNISWAPP